MGETIQVEKLDKNYGRNQVLEDISFKIRPGEVVGLLGPNGSGKTTLMKILAGLIHNYKGIVRVSGHQPDIYTKSIVSYLPEKTYFSDWMKGKDAIGFFKDFYSDFNEPKAYELFKRFSLDPEQKIKLMSKGMQEKVQIILTMSREADIYLLDEPLGGVDPASREAILDIILNNYSEDSSVVIATHLIHDIERIFDRVIFMEMGSILADKKTDDIRETENKSVNDYFKEAFKC